METQLNEQTHQMQTTVDFMTGHGLTAHYVTSFIRNTYRHVAATVHTIPELHAWADALGVGQVIARHVPETAENPIHLMVAGTLGDGISIDVNARFAVLDSVALDEGETRTLPIAEISNVEADR